MDADDNMSDEVGRSNGERSDTVDDDDDDNEEEEGNNARLNDDKEEACNSVDDMAEEEDVEGKAVEEKDAEDAKEDADMDDDDKEEKEANVMLTDGESSPPVAAFLVRSHFSTSKSASISLDASISTRKFTSTLDIVALT